MPRSWTFLTAQPACARRLAFLSAAAAELATGAPIATQLREAPILIALTFVAFTVASLVCSLSTESCSACNPHAAAKMRSVASCGCW